MRTRYICRPPVAPRSLRTRYITSHCENGVKKLIRITVYQISRLKKPSQDLSPPPFRWHQQMSLAFVRALLRPPSPHSLLFTRHRSNYLWPLFCVASSGGCGRCHPKSCRHTAERQTGMPCQVDAQFKCGISTVASVNIFHLAAACLTTKMEIEEETRRGYNI